MLLLKNVFSFHFCRFLSRSLNLSLSRFPNKIFKLLNVTSETLKYFIHSNRQEIFWRCTNIDLKIFLFVCIYKKIIPWKFRFFNCKNFIFPCFLSGFCFPTINKSKDCRGRGRGDFSNFSLPRPPASQTFRH